MMKLRVVGDLIADPEPKTYERNGQVKQFTTARLLCTSHDRSTQVINAVCYTEKNGEILRSLRVGDAVELRGNMTTKDTEHGTSIGLNVRTVKAFHNGGEIYE